MILTSYEPSDFKLSFKGALSGPHLELAYEWESELAVPAPHSKVGSRKIGLWEETCFEFFFAPLSMDCYIEINLTPSGDWNSFHFKSYREAPLREDSEVVLEEFQLKQKSLFARFALPNELSKNVLKANPTAIIAHLEGRRRFLAATHSKAKPDFHDPETFKYYLS